MKYDEILAYLGIVISVVFYSEGKFREIKRDTEKITYLLEQFVYGPEAKGR